MKQINSDKSVIYRKILGQVIEKYRIEKQVSQRLLADEYGISSSLLNRTVNGVNNPQLSSLIAISEALNVKLSVIIAEVEANLPEGYTLMDW